MMQYHSSLHAGCSITAHCLQDMFDSDVEYRVFLQHGDGGDLVQV